MAEIGDTLRVDGLTHLVSGRDNLAGGPLAKSRRTVHDALANSGFVDLVGASGENFKTYLNRQSFKIEVGDLKPGVLRAFEFEVAGEIVANSSQAQQAQAHVITEMAMKLLM